MIKVNKPKIRFKNFNDSWSLRKLSDTQTDFKDGNYGEAYPKETDLTSSTQGVPFLRGSDLDNGKLTLTNARYITQSKHNELISGHLIEDDIVIAVRGSLGSLGYVGPDNEGWNINSQLAIIRTRKIELIGNYLIQFLLSNRGNKEISSHITGTALKQLPIKQLKNIKIPIPKIEEQSAIGSLFRTLDDLLSSYKDNLTSYQSLKATMLSKMFPKAGQTVPEIRLDGFEGEWEVVNLGTLIENYDEIISGVSGFPIATSSRKGLYLQNDYFEGGRTGIDLTLDFHRVPMGYVTYRHMSDDSIFKFNKNNFETDVLVSKEYPVFMSNDSSNIDFILYHLNNSRLFLRFSTMQKLGGTRVRLYYKNLITYKLAVPTIKEQQAIGSYFSNLDNLINSYQEKITQLETLKKKLLQDMFI